VCGEFDSEGAGEKPNVGRDGAGASVISLEKNSNEFLFSRDVDWILLTLLARDIVWRERLRARTSWAFLLCEGAR